MALHNRQTTRGRIIVHLNLHFQLRTLSGTKIYLVIGIVIIEWIIITFLIQSNNWHSSVLHFVHALEYGPLDNHDSCCRPLLNVLFRINSVMSCIWLSRLYSTSAFASSMVGYNKQSRMISHKTFHTLVFCSCCALFYSYRLLCHRPQTSDGSLYTQTQKARCCAFIPIA